MTGPSPMDLTREIVREVADRYGVPLADLLGPCREPRFAIVRQAAYAEVKARRPHLSSHQIGLVFDRDLSTVWKGIETHRARMAWAECLIAAGAEPTIMARAA